MRARSGGVDVHADVDQKLSNRLGRRHFKLFFHSSIGMQKLKFDKLGLLSIVCQLVLGTLFVSGEEKQAKTYRHCNSGESQLD